METTETPAGSAGRPRPWLFVALGAVIALFLISRIWSGNPSAPAASPSNQPRPAPGTARASIDPGELDVRLEALTAGRAPAEESDRNPFRFQPKAAPPPPAPPPQAYTPPPAATQQQTPAEAGPPPITIKFIGIVEPKPGDKVAAFSDCRITAAVREGGIILGQYRLVRIGVESAVVEYVDGRGRTTIRMQGQECVK